MRNKTLIVSICILATLIVGYSVVSASNDPWVTGYLFEVAGSESVETIELQNSYGAFSFYQNDGEWTVSDGQGEYRAHTEKMELILAALNEFTVSRMLEENSPQYGLDDPYAIVRFRTDWGKEHTFSVGNTTISTTDNYVKGESGIGVTSAANVAQFDGSLTAYRDKSVFTVDPAAIVQLGYYQEGDLVISLARTDEGGWSMLYPFEAPARNILMSEFVEMLSGWMVAGFPNNENVTVEEMGLLEIDEALMLVDANGNEQVLEFGNQSGTARFVRTGGEDDVAMLYAADIDLSTMDPETMMIITPLMATVDRVKALTVEAGGEEYLFEVDDAMQVASVNGRLIEYEDFIHIFYRYITLMADGRDEAGAQDTQVVARMQTVYRDGSTAELTVLPRDDETYFMQINGETVYCMAQARLDDMLERIHVVLGQE